MNTIGQVGSISCSFSRARDNDNSFPAAFRPISARLAIRITPLDGSEQKRGRLEPLPSIKRQSSKLALVTTTRTVQTQTINSKVTIDS